MYTMALEKSDNVQSIEVAKCLSNRSLVSMQLENYGSSLADAE
jgi:hypothetical protein